MCSNPERDVLHTSLLEVTTRRSECCRTGILSADTFDRNMRNNDRSPVIDLAAMFNHDGATWCNDAMQEIISLYY